jgi:hypothetical protein
VDPVTSILHEHDIFVRYPGEYFPVLFEGILVRVLANKMVCMFLVVPQSFVEERNLLKLFYYGLDVYEPAEIISMPVHVGSEDLHELHLLLEVLLGSRNGFYSRNLLALELVHEFNHSIYELAKLLVFTLVNWSRVH